MGDSLIPHVEPPLQQRDVSYFLLGANAVVQPTPREPVAIVPSPPPRDYLNEAYQAMLKESEAALAGASAEYSANQEAKRAADASVEASQAGIEQAENHLQVRAGHLDRFAAGPHAVVEVETGVPSAADNQTCGTW